MSKVTKPKAGVKHIINDNFLTYYESPLYDVVAKKVAQEMHKEWGEMILGKPIEEWVKEYLGEKNNQLKRPDTDNSALMYGR